jgi:hypothetical protein
LLIISYIFMLPQSHARVVVIIISYEERKVKFRRGDCGCPIPGRARLGTVW